MIPTEKQILRNAARRALSAFPGKKWASEEISRRLADSAIWQNSRVIYAYHPLPSEPDWQSAALSREHVIAFPRIDGDRMEFLIPRHSPWAGWAFRNRARANRPRRPTLFWFPAWPLIYQADASAGARVIMTAGSWGTPRFLGWAVLRVPDF